jgi:hypothetical protein
MTKHGDCRVKTAGANDCLSEGSESKHRESIGLIRAQMCDDSCDTRQLTATRDGERSDLDE